MKKKQVYTFVMIGLLLIVFGLLVVLKKAWAEPAIIPMVQSDSVTRADRMVIQGLQKVSEQKFATRTVLTYYMWFKSQNGFMNCIQTVITDRDGNAVSATISCTK